MLPGDSPHNPIHVAPYPTSALVDAKDVPDADLVDLASWLDAQLPPDTASGRGHGAASALADLLSALPDLQTVPELDHDPADGASPDSTHDACATPAVPAVPDVFYSATPTHTPIPSLTASHYADVVTLCNVPLVAPRPLPCTPPPVLQFQFEPEVDTDEPEGPTVLPQATPAPTDRRMPAFASMQNAVGTHFGSLQPPLPIARQRQPFFRPPPIQPSPPITLLPLQPQMQPRGLQTQHAMSPQFPFQFGPLNAAAAAASYPRKHSLDAASSSLGSPAKRQRRRTAPQQHPLAHAHAPMPVPPHLARNRAHPYAYAFFPSQTRMPSRTYSQAQNVVKRIMPNVPDVFVDSGEPCSVPQRIRGLSPAPGPGFGPGPGNSGGAQAPRGADGGPAPAPAMQLGTGAPWI